MTAPRIRITSPAAADVRAWLHAQPDAPPPYPAAGSTRDAPTDGSRPPGVPAGWNVDHRRVRLGEGEAVYDAARAALMRFVPLDIGWVWPVTTAPRPQPGARGAMLVRAFGLTWVNAWRIVYVDDDLALPDGTRRTAFAYGTLEAHAERGEERFMVEMRPDGSVWFDILAYSRPHHWLARLGGPVTRWVQKRFGPASVGRMREAVRAIASEKVAPTFGEQPPDGALDVAPARYAQWPVHPCVADYVLNRARPVLLIGAFMVLFFGVVFNPDAAGDAARYLDFLLLILLYFVMVNLFFVALPLAMPYVIDRTEDTARVGQMVAFAGLVPLMIVVFTMLTVTDSDRSGIRYLVAAPSLWIVYVAGWFTRSALRPALRGRPRRGSDISDLVLRSAFVLWFVGTLWIAIDAANLSPLGFPQTIVRLTALHFHVAGFILPVIAATLARAYPSRLANAAAITAVLGVPSTAVGITATQLGAPHVVEAVLALPMIVGALLVAAVHLNLAFRADRGGTSTAPINARALRAVVGITLLATMALALAYALRGWLPWSPTIPQMAMWHGIGNAFGVATCGLVACWLDPATQPPVGGIAPSAATAAAP